MDVGEGETVLLLLREMRPQDVHVLLVQPPIAASSSSGIDLLRDVGAVLDYAFETAALRDARLRVVHAWQTFGTLIEAGYAVHGEQSELDLRAEVVEACKPLRAMRGDAITGRA